MDRLFPHDPSLDGPADEPEPRPERDPDVVRQERLDRAAEERAAYLDGVRRRARLYAEAAYEHRHNPRG